MGGPLDEPITGGDIKRSLHRAVQQYASEQSTPLWRGPDVRASWSEQNLTGVERLAQHVLGLEDDDPRFAAIADAFAGQEWRLADTRPWDPHLAGWLVHFGGTGGSGIPQDPDDFVSKWAVAVVQRAHADNPRR